MARKKSKPLTVKGAKVGMGKRRKLTVWGARIWENRVRPEPRPERPKARKTAKRGPRKTVK